MTRYALMGLTALALVACNDAGTPNVVDVKRAEARFDNVSESIVVQDASTTLTQLPQTFDTFSKTVQVQPANAEYKKLADTKNGAAKGAETLQSFLAYRYTYGLIMPAGSIKATTDKHIQLCRNACLLYTSPSPRD